MVEKIYAIIPARGGSKRIKKKNIIEIGGKPMIAWTIQAALETDLIDKVIVSTDCPEIAKVAKKYGAEVPFLRNDKADDISTVSEATIACIKQINENKIEFPEIVVQLMANCPLRTRKDIESSLNHFIKHKYDFQLSCFKYGWMNPWWAHKKENNKIEPLFPNRLKSKSQDLPKLYCPTGAIWIAKTKLLLDSGTFYGESYKFFEIDWINSIDIDDYEDLKMASYFFNSEKKI